jgi:HD-GYP domain-containing protein (c-di-GMP phosphodiesterase class II)
MYRGRGTHFDPNVLDVFLNSLDKTLTAVGRQDPGLSRRRRRDATPTT